MNTSYDYIITGGGLSGLSLAMRLITDPFFTDKKILLLERAEKNQNDRTWCYWEKGPGYFEDIVYRKWNHVWFHSHMHSKKYQLQPYQYKMIRGADLYNTCYNKIKASDRIELCFADVSAITNTSSGVEVITNKGIFLGAYVFSSIYSPKEYGSKGKHNLLQHFKGWVIETPNNHFDPQTATLMDFRMDQQHGATFVYVMPFSPHKALIEYTLFSKDLLTDDEYAQGLQHYIYNTLGIEKYSIVEEEHGVIPMTDYDFPEHEGNIVYLGTAGGQTKASSGYTFQFVQKQCDQIIEKIKTTGSPVVVKSFLNKRFKWFDKVLLHILYHRKVEGATVFSLLFKRNKISRIFSFLDNESKLHQELKLINSLPKLPFIKAGWKELFH